MKIPIIASDKLKLCRHPQLHVLSSQIFDRGV